MTAVRGRSLDSKGRYFVMRHVEYTNQYNGGNKNRDRICHFYADMFLMVTFAEEAYDDERNEEPRSTLADNYAARVNQSGADLP